MVILPGRRGDHQIISILENAQAIPARRRQEAMSTKTRRFEVKL